MQVSQQMTAFMDTDCLEDVGAEAVIDDEFEEFMATGELTEIKAEEERGDQQNTKDGRKIGKNASDRVSITTIKTNCRHRPIVELHGETNGTGKLHAITQEITCNSTQLAVDGREKDHRKNILIENTF